MAPDAESASAIAEIARTIGNRTGAPLVPVTAVGRGSRLLGSRVVPAVVATPTTILALMRASALKLDGIKALIIAWADELLEAKEGESLETVLAEAPKEAARIIVTDRMSPDVEALVERHLRRASRQGAAAEESPDVSLAIRYVTTVAATRAGALRRLLDDLDPPSAIVIATDGSALTEAKSAIESLGYHDDSSVRVQTSAPEENASLVVFYDLPASATDVAAVAAAAPAQVVALVTPRQIPALRRLTTGAVEPLDVSRATIRARGRDERIRAAIRAELQASFPAREVMTLEPLLAEFDGLEIAAAALRVFERERAEHRAKAAEAPRATEPVRERAVERGVEESSDRPAPRAERTAAPRSGGAGDFTRIFLSIGERDGVRPGDLVGAIAGESGITSDRIGKLEIRDGHTIAEIASADAESVIEKMNGVSIKGRRIMARVDDRPAPRPRDGDRDRPRRSGPREGGRGGFGGSRGGPREGRGGFGDRPREGRGGPGDRPREGRGGFGDRSRDRGPRGFSRDRDAGGERRPRRDGDRPGGRGGFRDRGDDGRVPRATRERDEWSERADRVRNARRPRRDEA
jgi:ATP-dependent RNA helicase DeaD